MSDITQEQLIEIMKSDGGSEICSVPDNALAGLDILKKYTDSDMSVIKGASHDVIYSISVEQAIKNGITEDEVKRLNDLNWMLEDDYNFACFV